MSLSRYPQVTPELLSAYIDNAVTPEERALVERAVANDAGIAAQLAALQQTVQLLHALPALALPRSFALDALTLEIAAEQAAKVERAVTAVPPKEYQLTPEPAAGRGSRWQQLLQALQGFPLYRNAAVVAVLLIVALLAGNWSYLYNGIPPFGQDAAPEAQVAMLSATAVSGVEAVAVPEAATADEVDDEAADVTQPAPAADQEQPVVTAAIVEAVTADVTPLQPTAIAVAAANDEAVPTGQVAGTNGTNAKTDADATNHDATPTAVATVMEQMAVAMPAPAAESGNPAALAQAEPTGAGMRPPGADNQDLNPSAPAMRTMPQTTAQQNTFLQENGPAAGSTTDDGAIDESMAAANSTTSVDSTSEANTSDPESASESIQAAENRETAEDIEAEDIEAEESEPAETMESAVAVARLTVEVTPSAQPMTDDAVAVVAANATGTDDTATDGTVTAAAGVTQSITTTPSVMAYSAMTTSVSSVITNAVTTTVTLTTTVASTAVMTVTATVAEEVTADETAVTITKTATPKATRTPTLVPKLTPTLRPTFVPTDALSAPLSPLATPAITATLAATGAVTVTETVTGTVTGTATISMTVPITLTLTPTVRETATSTQK